MEWINVKDKLPPLEVEILVSGKNQYLQPYVRRIEKEENKWVMKLAKSFENKTTLKNFLNFYEVTHYLIIPPLWDSEQESEN